jgi:tetratricopeptide (TPR) repeat protein
VPKETEKSASEKRRSSRSAGPRDRLKTALKWAAAITTLLSLIFAVHQFIELVGGARETQRQVAELLKVGKDQQEAGDYEPAWESFVQAGKLAEAGGALAKLMGSLSEEQRRVRNAQEVLAMAWVENAHAPQGEMFSHAVDKLVPALTLGAEGATGARKADLLAHLGWAYFLKARDWSLSLDVSARQNIERYYQEALKADPGNPYAHANWGHLMIWDRQNPDDALKHFSAAVASGRALAYVRNIELAAFRNAGENGNAAFLRVVADMVKNGEKVDARSRSDVYSIYYFALHSDKSFQRLLGAVPATEQLATVQALFYDAEFDSSKIPTREVTLALLQEAASLREEALKTWVALRSGLFPGSIYIPRADASIKRLSRKQNKEKRGA